MNTLPLSPEQARAITAGRRAHYFFEPTILNRAGWVYELDVPESDVIDLAKPRLELLRKEKIAFKRVIVAHEAPKTLPAPKPDPKPAADSKPGNIVPDSSALAGVLLAIFGVLGFIVFGTFLALVRIDPAVIVELSDGSFVEVFAYELEV